MYAGWMTDLEQRIVEKLEARAETSSICPSEVARDSARQLVARGVVRVTQGENEVDLDTVKGPIRLRRGEKWDSRPRAMPREPRRGADTGAPEKTEK